MKRDKRGKITAFISYVQIYSMFWFSVLLFFIPGVMTLKTFALFTAFASTLVILKIVAEKHFIIDGFFAITVLLMVVVLVGYGLLTPFIYRDKTVIELYSGELLAIAGQTFPAVLLAGLVGKDIVIQEKMKSFSFFVGILFSLIALFGVLNPSSTTEGGLVQTNNNLNYQTISYMAAYGAGLLLFNLINKEVLSNKYLRKKGAKIICLIVVLLDLVCVLISGGRGGLVDLVALCVLTLWLYNKKPGSFCNKTVSFIVIVLFGLLGGIIAIRFVASSNLATSGFSRIIGFLSGNGDSIRNNLFRSALNSFLTSPIFGHGFGSTFYEVGFYTHCFITDLLVETGIIGFIIVVLIIIHVIKYTLKLIKEDFTDSIWLFLLVSAITHYTFSGYYLVGFEPLWIIFMLLSKKRWARIDNNSSINV